MRIFIWALRAFLFFTLFAFALNNQQDAAVRWFFGHEWRAPMVIIVLVAFAAGCALGVLAMVPSWWQHRRVARRRDVVEDRLVPTGHAVTATEATEAAAAAHPPREGL